ncbi:MAG: leucine-rich repeat domain-containing protein [Planctomycetota bacterium]|nr:leucine-rich repeat domain-containing protein [Planctomycetota bacterium]
MATLNETPANTRRRWLRFSLRTLLIVFTVLGAVLGWVGWELEQVRKEKKAIAWVSAAQGVYVSRSGESGLFSVLKYRLFGGRVYYVHLKNTQVSDLSTLAELKKLESLRLSYTSVTDLSPLAELKNLESLHLDGTLVTDLSPLAALENLSDLDLRRTPVTDLSPLAKLKNLKELRLNETLVNDLSPLAGLKNLGSLSLVYTRVSDEQVQELRQALPNCKIIP